MILNLNLIRVYAIQKIYYWQKSTSITWNITKNQIFSKDEFLMITNCLMSYHEQWRVPRKDNEIIKRFILSQISCRNVSVF